MKLIAGCLLLAAALASSAEIDESVRLITDFRTRSGPAELILQRLHVGGGAGSSRILGGHWRSNWDTRLTRSPQDFTVEHMGRITRFTPHPGRSNEYTNAVGDRLVLNSSGSAQCFWGSGDRFDTFDTSGRLVLRSYRSAARFTLNYINGRLSRIRGPGGASLALQTNSQGQVVRVTASTGQTVDYTYNGNELASVSVNGARTATYAYDSEFRLIRVENPAMGAIHFAYDNRGRLTRTTYADGAQERVEYDDANQIERRIDASGGVTELRLSGDTVQVKDPAGRTTTHDLSLGAALRMAASTVENLRSKQEFRYDSEQRVTTIRQGNRTLLAMTYHPDGSVASEKRAGSPELRYEYFPDGRIQSVTNALGESKTYTYNSRGLLHTATNAAGGKTVYEYDPQDRLIRETSPAGLATSYQYDPAGRLSRIVAPGGAVTSYEYDVRGRKIAETGPTNLITRFEYDAEGRIAKVIRPGSRNAQFGYNAAGDLTSLVDSTGRRKTLEYRSDGTLLRGGAATAQGTPSAVDEFGAVTTDASGTKATYDAEGNIATLTGIGGHAASFQYDVLGRVVAVRKPSGGTARAAYNALGQVSEITGELGEKAKREYNPAGQLIRTIDATGRATLYRYNEQGRLQEKAFADGSKVRYEYDSAGRVTRMDDGAFPIVYSYDPATGLKTRVEYPAIRRSITYEYERGSGLRAAVVDNAGRRVSYSYNASKQLAALTLWDGGRIEFAYDPEGRVIKTSYPNGVVSTTAYGAEGQVTSMRHARGAEALQEWTYKFDARGNLSEARDRSGVARAYRYDAADQLIADGGNRYEYGPGGNRAAAGTVRYEHDAADRVIRAGAEQISYDASGNPIRREGPQGTTLYAWNAENRLAAVTRPGGVQIRYGYGPDGNRIWREDSKGRTWFVNDGIHVIAELDANLTEKSAYVFGAGIDNVLAMQRGEARHYFHLDRMGSVVALTDRAGRMAASFSYDAFGSVLNRTGVAESPFQFAAREFDAAAGLYHFRARYYDPKLGRFLTPDPNASLVAMPLELNPYLYAGNNPVRNVDPLGLAYLGRSNLLRYSVDLLFALLDDDDPMLAEDRSIAREILREKGHLKPLEPEPPRQRALETLKYLQETLESSNKPGFREFLGANNHDDYQADLRAKIRDAQDRLRRMPPDPPEPGNTGGGGGGRRNPTMKVTVDGGAPRTTGAVAAEPQPEAPNALVPQNPPPPRGFKIPILDADGRVIGNAEGEWGPPGPASDVGTGGGTGWWQRIKDSRLNNLPKDHAGKVGGALIAASVALCMSRGKSMTECLMEEALWVGAGAAAGLVMNPVTAAVTVAAIRMGLPGAIKGWLDATRNASNAEQTANITQLGAGVPKNLGVDELLERKARIEASLTAIDKKLAKASDPLAEKLRQDIEALEPDFRNAQVHCQAIQDAENDLASEKALAQRNRNSFIGFLNGAKGIAASCKTAAEAADLSRRITEVRQTLTALAKAVDRAKKVHFDLKLAAAKLNGLKSVIDDKQKLLEANERELKARGDALGEAQTEFAALRPEIANYYQAVDAALENIAKQLSVFPSPLPAGTPPAIVSSINKLRQVNQSTFRLPGGDLPEIASAKNRQFQSAKENLEKWTAIQAQMKAKLALYLRMLPCAQQISKALPGYADPRLAEIEAASSNSAAEDQLANLDAALAKCRGVSDCDTGFREAEDAIQLLDLDRARNKVQDLQRKNCQSAIAQALRGATEAKTNYENGTGTAMATCDFDGAIRLAQAIYQGYPRSPYAQAANASIVKLEGWKAAKARIQLLLQQAKTARDWPTSTIYLAEANGLALLPCLQDMVRKAEPDIQAAQLNKPKPTTATNPQDPNNNNNSQNTAKAGLGGSTGTVQDPQKPPARTTPGQQNNPLNPNNPPQNPNTPVAMHPCEGGFHAEPNTGFTGEQGRFNVQLAGADLAPVQEVAIRTRGADRILMTRLAQGRFTYTFRFQGIAGTIPITFVGKDRNGNDFCEHTIQVTSKGPR